MKKHMISHRFVFITALLLSLPAFTIQLQAQHGWSVNAAEFENSMQVTAAVSFDGARVTSGTLGAFVDDECRGFVDALEFESNLYVFDFLVYSNQSSGEIISFKYYNQDDVLIYDVNEAIEFVADTREGDALNPLHLSVTTNSAPVVDVPIVALSFDENFGNSIIDLDTVFSDPDTDLLVYSAVSSNIDVVTVSIAGSILTIAEAGLGSSTITVTADDGADTTDDVFTVTVNDVNEAPVVVSPLTDLELDEYFEAETVDLTGVFFDPDLGDVLIYTVESSDPAVVTATIEGSLLTITEVGLGSSILTVTATDNGTPVLDVSEEFTVTVYNVNDAPEVINPISDLELDEHFGTYNVDLTVVFSDKDEDPLTLSAFSSNTDVITVSVDDTTLTITETAPGSSVVTVTATDGLLSVDEQFQVIVHNVNDPPEVINPIADTALNEHFGTLVIGIEDVFSDPDGDVLLLTAESSDHSVVTVSVSVDNNLIVNEMGLGTAAVTVTAHDGEFGVDEQFELTVNNVNDAPVVVSPISSISRNEGFGEVDIDLGPVFIDPDSDTITYSVVSSNTNVVTVSISGTMLTITETGLGFSTITVTASDGLLSTEDQFIFSINNINDEPEVVQPIGNRSYNEGFSYVTINLFTRFSDPDGDILTFTAESSNTDVATVTVSGSILTIYEVGLGTSDITVTATDDGDGNLSASDYFTITVLNVNDAPQLENPIANQVRDENFGTLEIDLSDTFSDPDNDVLTISATSSNVGVVTVSMDGYVLRITEQGLGLSVIGLTASDGELSVRTQFTFTVNNVNDAPVVVSPLPDRVYDEGFNSVSFSLAPVFIDPDGNELSLSVTSSDPTVVTVSLSGTILTMTEVGPGVSTITVTASDGELSTAEEFIFTVNNVNDPPFVENPMIDREVDKFFVSVDINLSDVFSDPDVGDVLSYSAISDNSDVVTVSVAGAVLTITEVGTGVAIVTVTASDGFLSVEDQFTITVIDINVAPELTEPIPDQNMVENIGSAELDLDAYFSDPYGDALEYSVEIEDAGIVSYVLDQSMLLLTPVDIGSTMVTITATDPEGLMAEGTFTVHIEKELMFLVKYGSRRLQNRDTIILCNDAGQIDIKVISEATWGFSNDYIWIALENMHDTILSVAFSLNLTERDRIGYVTLFDEQGHELQLFVKQTEDCLTNVVPGNRRFDLKIHPNPVRDLLLIDTGKRLRRGMKVELIDQQGKLLLFEEVKEHAPDAPLEIDMRGYAAGPYFIRISDEAGSYTGKIVKQ